MTDYDEEAFLCGFMFCKLLLSSLLQIIYNFEKKSFFPFFFPNCVMCPANPLAKNAKTFLFLLLPVSSEFDLLCLFVFCIQLQCEEEHWWVGVFGRERDT